MEENRLGTVVNSFHQLGNPSGSVLPYIHHWMHVKAWGVKINVSAIARAQLYDVDSVYKLLLMKQLEEPSELEPLPTDPDGTAAYRHKKDWGGKER